MSFHTITIMVRWAVTAEEKNLELVENFRKIPLEKRENDPEFRSFIANLKKQWTQGTKIERLATLGWNEAEACKTFSNILEELPNLKIQYNEQIKIHGNPPELNDKDLDKYEKAINEERKNF